MPDGSRLHIRLTTTLYFKMSPENCIKSVIVAPCISRGPLLIRNVHLKQALPRGIWRAILGSALLGLSGCGSENTDTLVRLSDLDRAEGNAEGFLQFPESAADWAGSPQLLSQTGAFDDLLQLGVTAGILPYEVRSPLWSDGARKRRWMALPSGGQVGFSEQGHWSFPAGSVFIKHFEMALDERYPDELLRLETRFLIAAQGGDYYGLVYKWDADQSEARLLVDGLDEELFIVQADGSTREQTYSYPRQSACSTCHSAAAGHVMGVRTVQLNLDGMHGATGALEGQPENQLAALSQAGVFTEPLSDASPSVYPYLAALGDESETLEHRVRSYWDSNCSMCHNAASALRSWDARLLTPLAEQGVLMAVPLAGAGADDTRLIVPGDPERSLIYRRAASIEPGVRMPPLLRNRVDAAYVELLERWIESLPPEE